MKGDAVLSNASQKIFLVVVASVAVCWVWALSGWSDVLRVVVAFFIVMIAVTLHLMTKPTLEFMSDRLRISGLMADTILEKQSVTVHPRDFWPLTVVSIYGRGWQRKMFFLLSRRNRKRLGSLAASWASH